jgi:hypothetical protein
MSIALYILALTASNQSFCRQSRKSPGGGPPALLTRMSGSGHAAQVRLGARRHDYVDALFDQRERASLTESFTGSADDRLPAFDSKVHFATPD